MKRIICLIAIAVIFCLPVSAEDKIPSPTTTLFSVQFYDGNYNPISYIIEDGETFSHNMDLTRGSWQGWTFYNTDGTLAIAGTDFEWVDGSEMSANIEIKPLTDLYVCANYDEQIIPVQRSKKAKSLLKSSSDTTDEDEVKADKPISFSKDTLGTMCFCGLCFCGIIFGYFLVSTLFDWIEKK